MVERSARYDDHPRVSLRSLFRLAKTALFSFSTLPLTVFHVMGALATVLFLGLSGYSLFCKLFTDLAIPGWTSYVLIGSFFGAMNALGISILGEYVIRIYDQVRSRPLYLVDRTVNIETVAGAVSNGRTAGRPPLFGIDGAGRGVAAGGISEARALPAANMMPDTPNGALDDDALAPVLLPIQGGRETVVE